MKNKNEFLNSNSDVITKNFQVVETFETMKVIPTVIVTFAKHEQDNETIVRAYINYIVLGLNYNQEQSFEYISEKCAWLITEAEEYALSISDILYHY